MWHTIIIVGNLGRDPEMRYIPNGKPVTSFPVAASRKYTSNSGQSVEETVWFRVSVWDKQAEACNQYLKKGSKVLVEGRLTPDPATGGPRTYPKKDGGTGASFEVTASLVRFLSPKGDSGGGVAEEASDFSPSKDEGEDIPF